MLKCIAWILGLWWQEPNTVVTFEKRLKQLLNALKKKPEAVLFIDEIHMIIGAGSSMGSTMDASNLIKPALANGSLRCIGLTTFQEYRQSLKKIMHCHAVSKKLMSMSHLFQKRLIFYVV